jgi:hypothetical protein
MAALMVVCLVEKLDDPSAVEKVGLTVVLSVEKLVA